MNDKDIAKLRQLAKVKLEQAKSMTKQQAISSLNDAGILTKKGKLKIAYAVLEKAAAE